MNKDKVNLLLPKNSQFIKEDKSEIVTSIRIKKIKHTKQFKIQVLNGKNKIFETYLNNMSIRLKSGEDFLILEILNKKNVVIYIRGSKFLEDKEIKKYVNTLII